MGPGDSTVDFVCQENIGKDRSWTELKPTLFLIVEIDAGNVRWLQIRRKLDALELKAQ